MSICRSHDATEFSAPTGRATGRPSAPRVTPGPYAGAASTVVAPAKARKGATMSEQPTDRTAGTEGEAAKPEARDEQYGHLTVEDDPEGTTDEAELLRRHTSQDEA